MGLFGGGNSQSTSNVTNTQETTTTQVDMSGSAGASSQTIVGGSGDGTISANSYNAPLYLTPSTNIGDAAIKLAQQTAQASIAASAPSVSSDSGSILDKIFAGNNLYWIIGAVVLVMIWRGHHK